MLPGRWCPCQQCLEPLLLLCQGDRCPARRHSLCRHLRLMCRLSKSGFRRRKKPWRHPILPRPPTVQQASRHRLPATPPASLLSQAACWQGSRPRRSLLWRAAPSHARPADAAAARRRRAMRCLLPGCQRQSEGRKWHMAPSLHLWRGPTWARRAERDRGWHVGIALRDGNSPALPNQLGNMGPWDEDMLT
jgi:hypothetical protein